MATPSYVVVRRFGRTNADREIIAGSYAGRGAALDALESLRQRKLLSEADTFSVLTVKQAADFPISPLAGSYFPAAPMPA